MNAPLPLAASVVALYVVECALSLALVYGITWQIRSRACTCGGRPVRQSGRGLGHFVSCPVRGI